MKENLLRKVRKSEKRKVKNIRKKNFFKTFQLDIELFLGLRKQYLLQNFNQNLYDTRPKKSEIIQFMN